MKREDESSTKTDLCRILLEAGLSAISHSLSVNNILIHLTWYWCYLSLVLMQMSTITWISLSLDMVPDNLL